MKTALALVFLLSSALPVAPLSAADHWNVGLTANNTRVEALAISGPSASSSTVLLIGGLQGNDDTVRIVAKEAEDFEAIPQNRRPFRLLVIPLANPEGRPLQF